ncbi:MAG TPA: SAM-dependent methyltransferase [Micromonosporaceae bacterium]
MDAAKQVPAGIDLTRPSAARVYDYFLGGAHNYAVDRELAEQIAARTPNIGETMRSNRAFLRRAVRYLVGEGVRQFLDLGSGIPTAGNVHEVAQDAAPDSRVIYVDIDPVAVEHSRAILEGNERTGVLRADVREPDRILADAYALKLLDFGQPVAVLLAGVLHFVPDADDPATIVGTLREAVVDGSYLLISHATADEQPAEVIEAQRLSARTATEIHLRSRSEIAAYFDGFTLVEPGLVFIPEWRPDPDQPADEHPERVGAYAGVGRKD